MKRSTNNERWQRLEDELRCRTDNADDLISALRELYSLYTPELAVWYGNLYDSDLGGFYYSNSAKESQGFLPDIESTNQAFNFIGSSGLISSYAELPEWMRERTAFFIKYLQDPYSGFFYNLQWDKELTNTHPTRLARDVDAAHNIAKMLGFELVRKPEVSPVRLEILKMNGDTMPPHLRSKDAFRAYLESFDIKKDTYRLASAVVSQFSLLEERDLIETAYQFFERLQNAKTGLFENADNYLAIDSYYTISMFYTEIKKPLKYVKKAVPIVLNSLNTEAEVSATRAQHVWRAASNIVKSLRDSDAPHSAKDADEIVGEMMKLAPDMIRRTADMLSEFRKPDGSFSYNKNTGSPFSQGMPVAPRGASDGDVNATTICTVGTSKAVFRALDLTAYAPTILDEDSFADFLGAIKPPRAHRKQV